MLFAKLSAAGTIVDLWINNDGTAPLAQGYVDTFGWSGPIVQGATVVGAVCTAPLPVVPDSVDMWRARVALSRQPPIAGSSNATLLGDADTAVTAAGGEIAIFWEKATVLSRSNTNVAAIATALGLTNAQIDSLFITAAAVSL